MSTALAFWIVWWSAVSGTCIIAAFVDRWRARVWAKRTTTRIARVRREIARLDAINYDRRWR